MIDEFVALGGAADNVRLGQGDCGRGLFPIDPAKPVRLHTPPNLLIERGFAVFEDGAWRVARDAPVGDRERHFFERYQAAFCWEAGGQDECTTFVETMDAIPRSLRDLLPAEFRLDSLFEGDPALRVQTRFLTSRAINMQGRSMLMPIVELVNHRTGKALFDLKMGVSVSGTFDGEVLVRYQHTDALGIFQEWGFASREPIAFSLPLLVGRGDRAFGVNRELQKTVKRDSVRMPTVKLNGKLVTLSHIMLGNVKSPELPRRIFLSLMEDIPRVNAEEFFDEIRNINRQKFLKFIAALDEYEGAGVSLLRKMCDYQLETMSYCTGS